MKSKFLLLLCCYCINANAQSLTRKDEKVTALTNNEFSKTLVSIADIASNNNLASLKQDKFKSSYYYSSRTVTSSIKIPGSLENFIDDDTLWGYIRFKAVMKNYDTNVDVAKADFRTIAKKIENCFGEKTIVNSAELLKATIHYKQSTITIETYPINDKKQWVNVITIEDDLSLVSKVYDKKENNIYSNKPIFKKFTLSDGSTYEGYVINNDVYEGKGTYASANGDKYVGDFKNGTFEGKGFYTFANGNRYDGDFKNGIYEGSGTFIYYSGDKYIGNYKDGRYDGYGTSTFADGGKYVGNYKNGNYDGYGTFYYKGGTMNTGDWIAGVFQGSTQTNSNSTNNTQSNSSSSNSNNSTNNKPWEKCYCCKGSKGAYRNVQDTYQAYDNNGNSNSPGGSRYVTKLATTHKEWVKCSCCNGSGVR